LAKKESRFICSIDTAQPVELVMRRHAVILAATLAWFIGSESAEAKLDILVDKATQRMLVIQNGYIRYMWPVSTGRDELATPNGIYTPQRLERNWFSSAYYNSPMPYSIFFHNGYAIHGSYAIDKLGGPASHGCVRLHPHHAAVLFELVQQEGPDNTTIEISDEPRTDQASLPIGDVAAAQGLDPPPPRIIRYREPGDVPELPPGPRDNRSIAARNALPPRLAPVGRRVPTNVRPAASLARASAGAGQFEAANASPRPSGESSDSPAKAKSAEGAPVQQAPSIYGFKLLPASCWTGGASRWRWWASGQEASCK
jgi:L,D-transpeptidase catalytic domain